MSTSMYRPQDDFCRHCGTEGQPVEITRRAVTRRCDRGHLWKVAWEPNIIRAKDIDPAVAENDQSVVAEVVRG